MVSRDFNEVRAWEQDHDWWDALVQVSWVLC